ncbi:MAG: glutamine--tRNA ligase [Gammaproteobacteria bacterium CG22_combo_CG10-13_8_21_14_all_40_8]|nr:MAG: glutamine--tRNA ligase [Gammaproteobacteria bacterium CG22_combo_CG10-13_8_21_14_all_40_8]
MSTTENEPAANFIRHIILDDIANGKNGGKVQTRFPPEPNGYLHVGHAKSICLNFGIAKEFNGSCNLRFDDTNPEKESDEYAKSIEQDIKWLGFEWHKEIHHASDYFEQLYGYAVELIEAGLAFVDELNAEQMREYRGTLTEPGKNSPYRDRAIAENLDLFTRMRAGEFPDSKYVLRAKIDMSSPNINMRDPIIYRIKRAHHIRTGDKWCIYPMYDFTHCISDALEGITHSLCTLEFEDHRPLYDWVLDNISLECHPQQIEFSRLALAYTITSKRKLTTLVSEKFVDGWDDPRMSTLSGMRRRGYPAASLRHFCTAVGISKKNHVTDMGLLEQYVRDELNVIAPRGMAVLRPLKVVIENYPEDKIEQLEAPIHPQNEAMGTRKVPFSREIYIDQEDFMEEANNKFKRLVLDKEVRLRNAYVIHCHQVIKDEQGNMTELRCTYDNQTLGKNPEGRKVKGVIHWVSASESVAAEVRVYDRLFNTPNPAAAEDFRTCINPNSLSLISSARVEPSLAEAKPEQCFQFEREGYFVADRYQHSPEKPVFNMTVGLRDTWNS